MYGYATFLFSLFPLLSGYEHKSLYRNKIFFLLGRYLWLVCRVIWFSFLGNCQAVFQSVSTVLHSYQKCMRIPILHSITVFFIIAILVGVKWYLTEVLICMSLMTNERGWVSLMCLLAIHISSLVKYLSKSFANFLIGWFSYWII